MKKVEHNRKGYIRKGKDGKEIFVRATTVNKGNKKKKDKEEIDLSEMNQF